MERKPEASQEVRDWMRSLVKRRWDKTSDEDKSAHARKMVAAREAKRQKEKEREAAE